MTAESTVRVRTVPRWMLPLAIGIAAAVAAAFTAAGSPIALGALLIAAAVPWLIVLAPRVGGALALAEVVIAAFAVIFVVPVVTAFTGLPMLGTFVVVLLALALSGAAVLLRFGSTFRTARRAWLVGLAAAAGAAIWAATMVVASFLPHAARLSWVMLGDSANNLLFARLANYANGITLGGGTNPVPLPSEVLALFIAPGRVSPDAGELLRHDLTGFAVAWSLLIMATCVMSGAAVGAIVQRATDRRAPVLVAAAGASLLPLSWFFTGYPLEFGFLNTHVTLPIVLAAFLAFLSSTWHPARVLALLAVAATLLLVVWSPFVLIPGVLGLAVVVQHARRLLQSRGWLAGVLIAALLQLVAFGLLIMLPSLIRNASFLSAPGGAFGFRRWVIVAVGIAVVGLALFAFRSVRNVVVIGVCSVVAACALGLGALLFTSRNEPSPWTYYPLKFMWLAIAVLVVLLVGVAAAAVVRAVRPIGWRLAGFGLLAASVVVALGWMPSGPSYPWMNPVQRVVTGQFLGTGDEVLDQIVGATETGQSHFLWHTDDPWEGSINFWLLQMWANSMDENFELKQAGYGLYDDEDIDELCRVVGLMGGGTIVHTSIEGLQDDVDRACPGEQITVAPWRPAH